MNPRLIVYIDDDEDDQELFQMAVGEIDARINCIAVYDARQAWIKLTAQEWIPDTIFLDLNMPVLSGKEFLDKLKQHDTLKNIQVIILSTSSEPRTIKLMREKGAHDFLTKPRSYPELVKILQPLLTH